MHPFRPEPTQSTPWVAPAWLEHFFWWVQQPVTGRWLSPFCIAGLISVWAMTGCSNMGMQIQVRTADSIAEAGNSALPILVERYQAEGDRVLQRLKGNGRATQSDARATIDKVKAKWKPIWDAWDALAAAQNAWAETLENDGDTGAALSSLKGAYCDLRKVWPKEIPAVPLGPLRCAQ